MEDSGEALEDRIDADESGHREAERSERHEYSRYEAKAEYSDRKDSKEYSSKNNKSEKKEKRKSNSVREGLEQLVGKENGDSGNEEQVYKGSVAIIYHLNKLTGELEFYVEENTSSYPVAQFRNKLRLVGGSREPEDSTSLDTEIREISEEFKDKQAAKILTGNLLEGLDSYTPHTVTHYVEGIRNEITLYQIEVPFAKGWEIVKNSPFAHPRHIMTSDEILGRSNSDFAFADGPELKNFILEKLSSSLSGYGSHKSGMEAYNMPYAYHPQSSFNVKSNSLNF